MTFEGQGELLVRETSLLIDDASELEWAFPPTVLFRLLKITTAEPQRSFWHLLQYSRRRPSLECTPGITFNINVRLPGDDGDEGRATCLVTFYGNAPYTFDELPQNARNCATIPRSCNKRRPHDSEPKSLQTSWPALKTVSTRLPGEESLYITLVAIDEAGNISRAARLAGHDNLTDSASGGVRLEWNPTEHRWDSVDLHRAGR